MIKTLLIGFNFIGLFLFNLFLANDVILTHNLPSSLSPGEEIETQITINKSEIKGFAKLQIEVASGISISAAQNAGASFTFSDSKAKFIWVDLPATSEFVVKFKVKANDNATGDNIINIKFSYIDNNERKNVDSPMHIVKINSNIATNNTIVSTENENTKETISAETTPTNVSESVAKTEAVADTSLNIAKKIVEYNTNNQNVDVTRTIKKQDNGNYIVVLEIQKEEISGFAKLEETVPEEFSAVNLESSKAIFSNSDKLVKFVWFSVPNDNLIQLSYMLIPAVVDPIKDFIISGEFSYLDKSEVTQKVLIEPTVIGTPQNILANNAAKETIVETSTNLVPEKTADLIKIENTKEITTETIAEVTTSTENANSAITQSAENLVVEQQRIVDSLAVANINLLNEQKLAAETKIATDAKLAQDLKVAEDAKIATENKLAENIQQNTSETAKTVVENVQEETAKIAAPDKTETKINQTSIYPITRIPYSEKGISYRVQISAGKKIVAQNYFSLKYGFSKEFISENHEGWIKYTTGSHPTYKEARDERESIKVGFKFPGPFVTAYSEGSRITVQEALMATNQKWIS
jgi:hypothetical protein